MMLQSILLTIRGTKHCGSQIMLATLASRAQPPDIKTTLHTSLKCSSQPCRTPVQSCIKPSQFPLFILRSWHIRCRYHKAAIVSCDARKGRLTQIRTIARRYQGAQRRYQVAIKQRLHTCNRFVLFIPPPPPSLSLSLAPSTRCFLPAIVLLSGDDVYLIKRGRLAPKTSRSQLQMIRCCLYSTRDVGGSDMYATVKLAVSRKTMNVG